MASVIILVADGVGPELLERAMDRGDVPALAALRGEGESTSVTTSFPSVTGVAYAPLLMGRFPGEVGLPGLRWFDRTGEVSVLGGHSRSYVGIDALFLDGDLDPRAPTLFELSPGPSLGASSVITRGLSSAGRLGQDPRSMARLAWMHVRGDVRGWLAIDRTLTDALVWRVRRDRPRFAFAALTGVDKASHAGGQDSPLATEALRIVDDAVARLRIDAERDGRWRDTHLWVVSDHGHSPVDRHDELASVFRSLGLQTRSHPWMVRPGGDAAVMVSGNAMAHVYVDLWRRDRPFWPALRGRWNHVTGELLARPSLDLLVLPHSPTRAEVRARGRGAAMIERTGARFTYRPLDGDPLGVGAVEEQSAAGALEATADSHYPDSIVQIASLAGAARSGDMILSAAPGWDFRSRYEPIVHRSSHGSLRREHVRVPLLLNRPAAERPRRTADVMPSALRALGVGVPAGLDGCPFV